MSDTKNCPFCGESIKAVAIKCKHCESFISNESVANENEVRSIKKKFDFKDDQKNIAESEYENNSKHEEKKYTQIERSVEVEELQEKLDKLNKKMSNNSERLWGLGLIIFGLFLSMTLVGAIVGVPVIVLGLISFLFPSIAEYIVAAVAVYAFGLYKNWW